MGAVGGGAAIAVWWRGQAMVPRGTWLSCQLSRSCGQAQFPRLHEIQSVQTAGKFCPKQDSVCHFLLQTSELQGGCTEERWGILGRDPKNCTQHRSPPSAHS